MQTPAKWNLVPIKAGEEAKIEEEDYEQLRQLEIAAETAQRVAMRYRQELLQKYKIAAASSLIAVASGFM